MGLGGDSKVVNSSMSSCDIGKMPGSVRKNCSLWAAIQLWRNNNNYKSENRRKTIISDHVQNWIFICILLALGSSIGRASDSNTWRWGVRGQVTPNNLKLLVDSSFGAQYYDDRTGGLTTLKNHNCIHLCHSSRTTYKCAGKKR